MADINTCSAKKRERIGRAKRQQTKAVYRVLDPEVVEPGASGFCALAVMTKAPRAGQVKTRLVPPLTPDEAAELNVCFLRDTTAAISEACGENARGIAVYTPVGAEADYIDILPRGFQLVPQRGEGFGERLALAVEDLFQIGFASVCLIDSDSPTIPAKSYADAARLLSMQGDRVVLGPSDDGGYYLIGLNKMQRRLFEKIDWSTERVLAQTTQRAAEFDIEVKLLPTGYDVDDCTTLRRLCHELLGHDAASTVATAPNTREFLRKLVTQKEL
jgi:rSAM/selenodomain-associated transferase 1